MSTEDPSDGGSNNTPPSAAATSVATSSGSSNEDNTPMEDTPPVLEVVDRSKQEGAEEMALQLKDFWQNKQILVFLEATLDTSSLKCLEARCV